MDGSARLHGGPIAARTAALLIAALAVAFLHLGAAAEESASFDRAVSALASSLASSGAAAKPLRVAFLPFSAQGKAARADSGFGAFVADQLAVRAKKASASFRIFERSRLSDILAENELQLSGLIDADQAMRVGSLAPVDALVSGSYAADSSALTLTVRLVSVVTGELLFTGTERSAIDGGATAFFGPDAPAAVQASPAERLKAAAAEMKRLLADLSTEAKVEKAVARATGYPLFGDYSPIHGLVADSLERYGKENAAYRSFLLGSMRSAELVDGTEETYALIDAAGYLAAFGLDEEESAAILDAAAVMTDTGYYNVVFQYALGLSRKAPAPAAAILDARVDAIMARAKAGTMGRPSPVSAGACLDELLGALQGQGRAQARAYRSYAALLKGRELDSAASDLKRSFDDEKEEATKRELLSLLVANYRAREFGQSLAQGLWNLAQSLDASEEKRPWAAELARLAPALLSKSILAVPYNKDDRIEFCLRYGIEAPGLVPALADIKRNLAYGETVDERRRAAAMLIAMGPKAAAAEESVRQTLKFIQDKSIDGVGSPNLQEECCRIIAAIPSPKDETLAVLALGLDHPYSDVRDSASGAIERIGERALPYLKPRIASGERSRREEVLRLLGRMGKRARGLSADLEKAAAAEKDEYLKGLILDTLSKTR